MINKEHWCDYPESPCSTCDPGEIKGIDGKDKPKKMNINHTQKDDKYFPCKVCESDASNPLCPRCSYLSDSKLNDEWMPNHRMNKMDATICNNCGEQMLGPVTGIGYYCPNAFACGNAKSINQKIS